MISRLFGYRTSLSLVFALGLVHSVLAVVPSNDNCVGAINIASAGPFPYYTSTVDVRDATTTNDPPGPSCSVVSVNRSIWFTFTPSATRLYTISASKDTATTVFDTVMAIYKSSSGCNGIFTEVQCNDDQDEETRSAISVTLNANVTYYIVVWMSSLSPPVSGMTSLQLRVSAPVAPPNDTCAAAEIIPANGPFPYLTAIADTTLATATGDPPAPSCAADHVRSVWFRFAPATAATYELSLCTNTATTVYETVLAIYTSANGCAGPFTQLACNHTNICSNLPRSILTLPLAKDATYYIVAWDGVNAVYTPGETSLQLRVAALLPPAVATLPASSITSTSAVLNGTVNPSSLPTTAWFEWGTTTNYGSTTTAINLGAGSASVPLSANINGLQPLTYHFRAVANNSLGTTLGADRSFIWSAIPPRLSIMRSTGTYTLQLAGQSGQIYIIEATQDLIHWTTLGTANDLGAGNFTLSDPTQFNSRFYRVRSP